jgi:hydrogenase nickel incorporation protein HypB
MEHEEHDHDHHEHAHVHQARHTRIRLEREILSKNAHLARENREWLDEREIVALNLVSSPGAGKTTLLERTLRELGPELFLSVIEGDQETDRDAERIRATGTRVVQVNTGTGCHLDAAMVARALPALEPRTRSLVFVENVGNLVCPALFDLGEHAKVVIGSVAEGDDKPAKYPHIFRASELFLINKVDLLPYVRFDMKRCLAHARAVNPLLRVIQISATHGEGLPEWFAWVRAKGYPARAGLK